MYLLTKQPSPAVGTALVQRIVGLGACSGGDSCRCGGCRNSCGLGLFDSGMDVSQWGAPEYIIGGVVVIGLFSLFSGGKRAYGSVRKASRSRASKARRKAQLQEELRRL